MREVPQLAVVLAVVLALVDEPLAVVLAEPLVAGEPLVVVAAQSAQEVVAQVLPLVVALPEAASPLAELEAAQVALPEAVEAEMLEAAA